MRGALVAAVLLALAACATGKKPAPAPPNAPPPPEDASYDWHVLIVAPFGSVVKQVPFKLHEVLLFKDRESDSAEAGECYASDESPPTFLKRTPSQLLLCFRHDHLWRIEAVVMLPKDEAREILSNACALWHRHAGEAAADEGVPCAGSDGGVHYDAHPDEEAADGNEVPLSLQLEQVAPRES